MQKEDVVQEVEAAIKSLDGGSWTVPQVCKAFLVALLYLIVNK